MWEVPKEVKYKTKGDNKMKILAMVTAVIFCVVVVIVSVMFGINMYMKNNDMRIEMVRWETKSELMKLEMDNERLKRAMFLVEGERDAANDMLEKTEEMYKQSLKDCEDNKKNIVTVPIDIPNEDIVIVMNLPGIGPVPIPIQKGALNKKNNEKYWWTMEQWEEMAKNYKKDQEAEPGNGIADPNKETLYVEIDKET